MVEKKYFCNLCRDQINPEGTNSANTGTGFAWIAANHRFKLIGLDAANNHICWACIKAVGEHDRELRTTNA